MATTLDKLEKYVGSKTALLNSSDQFVDGIVSQTDLRRFINVRTNELFMEMAERYPENFEMSATFDLVADQEVYTILGEAKDFFTLRYVGIKYTDTDTKYKRLRERDVRLLKERDTDTTLFSTSNPYYYRTSFKEDVNADGKGDMIRAIGILPVPTANVTAGGYIRYVELPRDMSKASDEPYQIPESARHLISMAAIADVWEAKGDWQKSERAMNRYMYQKKDFFDNYQPDASDEPAIVQLNRSFNPNIRRRH